MLISSLGRESLKFFINFNGKDDPIAGHGQSMVLAETAQRSKVIHDFHMRV